MTTNSNSSIKILVVDDEPELLQITELLLKKENYNVSTATSGQGCLEAINSNKPDLLLLDVMLPDVNGREICKTVKNNPNLTSIYVFLISGLAIHTESISEGLELGADGYLTKPINNRELLARIESAVRIIHTEKALRESEEKFRNIFDLSVVGKSMTAMDGTLRTNKAFRDILGYSEDELREIHWQEITHPDDIENNTNIINSIISFEKQNARWEKRYIHKNGNIVWVDISTTLMRDNDGTPLQFITSIIDISEQKQAREILQKSEEYHRSLLTNLEAGVVAHAPDTSIIMCNRRASELLGLSEDQLRGKMAIDPRWKFIHENHITFRLDEYPVNRIIETVKPFKNLTVGVVIPDYKDINWLLVNGIPILDNNGKIAEILISFIDITELKMAEESLQESELKLKTLIEYIPQKVFMKDLDYKWIFVNKNLADDLEIKPEDVVGKIDSDFFPSELAAKYHADDERIIKSGQTEDMVEKYIEKGEDRWLNTVKTAIKDENNKIIGIIGLSWDITERKQTEEKLEKQNDYIKMILDNFPIGIATNEIDSTKVTYMNRKFSEIYGWPEDEFPDVGLFFEKVFPDMEYRQQMQTRILEDMSSGDMERMNWDNLKIATKAGDQRIVHAFNIPLLDQNIMVSTVQDITERKHAEEKIQNQLDELRRWYEVTLDREGRVLELKQEVNELLKQHGEALRYESDNPEVE